MRILSQILLPRWQLTALSLGLITLLGHANDVHPERQWLKQSTPNPTLVARLNNYLKADNAGTNDYAGWSIASDGNTLVVGAPGEASNSTSINGDGNNDAASGAGAAYVFVRGELGWEQQAYLKADNAELNDGFGDAVALSGNTVVIGAPAEDGDASAVSGADNNHTGGAGAVYVFVREGSSWSQQAYLKASNAGDQDGFGSAVAIAGDTLVIGAPREDGDANASTGNNNDNTDNAGAAYVFVREGSSWSQQAYLKAANAGLDDRFGDAVAIDQDTVVVGAPFEDGDASAIIGSDNDNAVNAGAAYVFTRNTTVWSLQAYLKGDTDPASSALGSSVAIAGDLVVIGAPLRFADDGAAYIFGRDPMANWSQQAYLEASNRGQDDLFGWSVAISGDRVAIGAPNEDGDGDAHGITDNNNSQDAGAAYVFGRDGDVDWSQHAYVKADPVDAGDMFGFSIALSGDTLIAGGIFEDSDATAALGSPNNAAPNAGAVYAFELFPVAVFSDGFEGQ